MEYKHPPHHHHHHRRHRCPPGNGLYCGGGETFVSEALSIVTPRRPTLRSVSIDRKIESCACFPSACQQHHHHHHQRRGLAVVATHSPYTLRSFGRLFRFRVVAGFIAQVMPATLFHLVVVGAGGGLHHHRSVPLLDLNTTTPDPM
uniref:Uncharacterized protein n=1 Tax=Anopheles culicifacies TaxID=139723 RepID=A0A182MCG6_9DIPT